MVSAPAVAAAWRAATGTVTTSVPRTGGCRNWHRNRRGGWHLPPVRAAWSAAPGPDDPGGAGPDGWPDHGGAEWSGRERPDARSSLWQPSRRASSPAVHRPTAGWRERSERPTGSATRIDESGGTIAGWSWLSLSAERRPRPTPARRSRHGPPAVTSRSTIAPRSGDRTGALRHAGARTAVRAGWAAAGGPRTGAAAGDEPY